MYKTYTCAAKLIVTLIVCPPPMADDHHDGAHARANAISPIVSSYSHRSFKCQTTVKKIKDEKKKTT